MAVLQDDLNVFTCWLAWMISTAVEKAKLKVHVSSFLLLPSLCAQVEFRISLLWCNYVEPAPFREVAATCCLLIWSRAGTNLQLSLACWLSRHERCLDVFTHHSVESQLLQQEPLWGLHPSPQPYFCLIFLMHANQRCRLDKQEGWCLWSVLAFGFVWHWGAGPPSTAVCLLTLHTNPWTTYKKKKKKILDPELNRIEWSSASSLCTSEGICLKPDKQAFFSLSMYQPAWSRRGLPLDAEGNGQYFDVLADLSHHTLVMVHHEWQKYLNCCSHFHLRGAQVVIYLGKTCRH